MTTKQRLTDRKREAIVKAAMTEFRTYGFETTTMDKVAAAAEVSKRTLYNHFPSKEQLFAEILMQLWQLSESQLDMTYRDDQPVRKQLLALMLQKLAMLSNVDFIDFARVAIAATIHSPERAQDMLARLGEKESALLAWIKSAQKGGSLRAGDAALAAQQMESLIKGVAFWPQVTISQPPLNAKAQKQLAAAAVDLFLSHYGR